MKKALFIIVAVLLVFSACDEDREYSDEQRNTLDKLNGNYHAYVDNEVILAVISFMARHEMPLPIYDGNKILFYGHGECFFSDSEYFIPEKGYIPCYYSISKNIDIIYFYYKGGENSKSLLREYGLYIENDDVFTLKDNGRLLRFEKVKQY